VEIDVGGRRKDFYGCAIRGAEFVAGPERLADVARAAAWILDRHPDGRRPRARGAARRPGSTCAPDERELNRRVCGIR
jgi:hypothetical protein